MISLPVSSSCLLRLLAILAAAHCARSQLVDDADCDCYLINGSVTAYYAKRMFYDFRSLSHYAGIPDVRTNSSTAHLAPYSSNYFSHDNWTNVWDIQTWDNSYGPGEGLSNNAYVLMVNSRSNVFIEENGDDDAASDTYMTLRTKRIPGFQTVSEFQSVKNNYRFVSMRMLARTVGSAGAVTGMYTYRDESGELVDIQESDVEILTRGPRNKVQYTNQPSYTDDGGEIPRATRNATTPDWSDWVVHRLDWTPEVVKWYVNGDEVASIEFQTPKDATDLHFSAWSDGGTWSGNMSMNQEASQQIQWIEVLYNTTTENLVEENFWETKRDEDTCNAVCSIDETTNAGEAAVLWDNAGVRMSDGRVGGWVTWIIEITLGVMIWI